jgi:hypothetical protein
MIFLNIIEKHLDLSQHVKRVINIVYKTVTPQT